jgi:Domain of unknown function (DUF4112)
MMGNQSVHQKTYKRPTGLRVARFLAWLLDNSIKIPFTKKKIGLDGLIGLVPALGDAIPILMTAYTMGLGIYYKAPLSVVARMGINGVVDSFIGAIPLGIGDLLDFAFKSHKMNLDMLEKHLQEQHLLNPEDCADEWLHPPSEAVIEVQVKSVDSL